MYFENLCKRLSALPEVESIALGGSRAGDRHDEKSDYDLYIYEELGFILKGDCIGCRCP